MQYSVTVSKVWFFTVLFPKQFMCTSLRNRTTPWQRCRFLNYNRDCRTQVCVLINYTAVNKIFAFASRITSSFEDSGKWSYKYLSAGACPSSLGTKADILSIYSMRLSQNQPHIQNTHLEVSVVAFTSNVYLQYTSSYIWQWLSRTCTKSSSARAIFQHASWEHACYLIGRNALYMSHYHSMLS